MDALYCVVTITNEFMAAHTPRDLRLFLRRDKAVDCYNRLRDQRLAAKTHVKVMETDDGTLKMCVLRDRDGYVTSISMVPVETVI